MYTKKWLPYALSIGMTETEFWNSTMLTLKAHIEAHEMKMKMRDEEMWRMGIYIQSAFNSCLDSAFNGKSAKTKYIKEPMLEKWERDNKPLTNKEKKKQLQLFATQLSIFETNFNLLKDIDKRGK